MNDNQQTWTYIAMALVGALIVYLAFPYVFGTSNYVDIKYREDKVNVSANHFEKLDTSNSSFIRGAWYDEDQRYMVISLNGTYYHYCNKPVSSWSEFKKANSYGSYYNERIRGYYDCRLHTVPKY